MNSIIVYRPTCTVKVFNYFFTCISNVDPTVLFSNTTQSPGHEERPSAPVLSSDTKVAELISPMLYSLDLLKEAAYLTQSTATGFYSLKLHIMLICCLISSPKTGLDRFF